mmetsp:Transcript_101383/g.295369  ORF Transcript_101383/g.295369 Transcript_101383/m.295369 type:complete len:213 (+) Transcript_101383:64-702(+)
MPKGHHTRNAPDLQLQRVTHLPRSTRNAPWELHKGVVTPPSDTVCQVHKKQCTVLLVAVCNRPCIKHVYIRALRESPKNMNESKHKSMNHPELQSVDLLARTCLRNGLQQKGPGSRRPSLHPEDRRQGGPERLRHRQRALEVEAEAVRTELRELAHQALRVVLRGELEVLRGGEDLASREVEDHALHLLVPDGQLAHEPRLLNVPVPVEDHV